MVAIINQGMNTLYFIVLIIFGLFLVWSGFMMFVNPEKVKKIIALAGSTLFINYAELITRLIIGIAFVFVKTKYNFVFTYVGYFLIISALILMLVPIKKHNKFSVYASQKLKPIYLSFFALISIIMGILIIYGIL